MDVDAGQFATAVARGVTRQHPVPWTLTVDTTTLAGVQFSPGDGAVPVLLTTYFDGTFQLEAGDRLVEEWDSEPGSMEEQVDNAVSRILAIAREGVVYVRTYPWMGPLSPSFVDVPSADEIVKASRGRWGRVVKRWTAWPLSSRVDGS